MNALIISQRSFDIAPSLMYIMGEALTGPGRVQASKHAAALGVCDSCIRMKRPASKRCARRR